MTNVQESGNGSRLEAGGYVCVYTSVTDMEDKEYLYMEFDIAEGKDKGYYKELEERAGFWGGKVYRSYKPTALPMFKRMCSAVNKSNPGFVFDGNVNSDESTLVGKKVGIVLAEEEYIGNDGSVKTRLYVAYECNADDIRRDKYSVPAKKCVNKQQGATLPPEGNLPSSDTDGGFVTADSTEEIPFG